MIFLCGAFVRDISFLAGWDAVVLLGGASTRQLMMPRYLMMSQYLLRQIGLADSFLQRELVGMSLHELFKFETVTFQGPVSLG